MFIVIGINNAYAIFKKDNLAVDVSNDISKEKETKPTVVKANLVELSAPKKPFIPLLKKKERAPRKSIIYHLVLA